MLHVLGMAREDLEVLDPVVIPNTVDVMNDFVGLKIAADGVSHDKPVLQHVAIGTGHRVLGQPDVDVTVLLSAFTTRPMRSAARVVADRRAELGLVVPSGLGDHYSALLAVLRVSLDRIAVALTRAIARLSGRNLVRARLECGAATFACAFHAPEYINHSGKWRVRYPAEAA